MYFLSALYMLQYVLIVKMTFVILIQKKTKKNKQKKNKKQKKQTKMTHTSVWVKKYQSYATRPRYLSFSWEREGILMSPNLT